MRSYPLLVLLLAVAGVCHGGEGAAKSDPVAMAKAQVVHDQEQLAVYQTIKNAATAQAAKPKLEALERKLMADFFRFGFFPPPDKLAQLALEKAQVEQGQKKSESAVTKELVRLWRLPKSEGVDAVLATAREAAADEMGKQVKALGLDLAKLDQEQNAKKPEPLTPELATAILDGIKDDPGLLWPTRETVRRQLEAKVGDWVNLRDSGVEMETLKRSGNEKYTVESIDASGVTIVKELNLQWEGKPQKRNTKDRLLTPYDVVTMTLRTPFLMVSTKYKTASGEETLRVGGKDYKCMWVETKENQQNGSVFTMKTWICPEAPMYGALKQIQTMNSPGLGQVNYTVVEVVEFGTAATAKTASLTELKKPETDVEKLERERSGSKEQQPDPFAPGQAAAIPDDLKDDPNLLYPTKEALRRHRLAKVGDWISVKNSGTEMQKPKRNSIEKYTVATSNADGMVLTKELSLLVEGKPQKPSATDKVQSSFDVANMRGPFVAVNAKHKTASGEETLSVAGKEYKCTWVETKENKDNGSIFTTKTWICPEAPLYGALKQIRTTELFGLGRTDHTVVEVVDFGTLAAAPVKTGAKK